MTVASREAVECLAFHAAWPGTCCADSCITCGHAALQVIIKQGVPRLRPFPGALKQWVLPASASTDFQYLLLCMLFLQARPMALVRPALSPLASSLSAALATRSCA